LICCNFTLFWGGISVVNTRVFKTLRGILVPEATAVNEAGGAAYAMTAKEALAQLAVTGCFGGTYYVSVEDELETVTGLLKGLDSSDYPYVAKLTVYSRQAGYMKDMPALLLAWLSTKDLTLVEAIWDRVITNGRMLRNYIQIIRSGVMGRKSFGSKLKRLIQGWLARQHYSSLLNGSVGKDPSLADIIKMVHPKPADTTREAMYGWLIGDREKFESDEEFLKLPEVVQDFERFKNSKGMTDVPRVDFRLLAGQELSKQHWTDIMLGMPWHALRMNLNTFKRHGVFEDKENVAKAADKLVDEESIKKAKVFPYQLLAAYKFVAPDMPQMIIEALETAMEISTSNIPEVPGTVAICPDTSGSMTWSSVTGNRGTASSKMRPVDVAALVASCVLRKNPDSLVFPFDTRLVPVRLNPRDTVMTNANILGRIGGGGTNCAIPIEHMTRQRISVDLILYISDDESWMDNYPHNPRLGSNMFRAWSVYKANNPSTKMVCIDVQPNTTTQVQTRPDVLNIGGFSDKVFDIISDFVSNPNNPDRWVSEIEKTDI
jgi:60 kDa SS-A/Ro ribonucleoprotein